MIDLNCQGMPCPLPLLKLKVALHEAQDNAQICLTTTDVISQRDIPAFVARTTHRLIEQSADGTIYRFVVQKSL